MGAKGGTVSAGEVAALNLDLPAWGFCTRSSPQQHPQLDLLQQQERPREPSLDLEPPEQHSQPGTSCISEPGKAMESVANRVSGDAAAATATTTENSSPAVGSPGSGVSSLTQGRDESETQQPATTATQEEVGAEAQEGSAAAAAGGGGDGEEGAGPAPSRLVCEAEVSLGGPPKQPAEPVGPLGAALEEGDGGSSKDAKGVQGA